MKFDVTTEVEGFHATVMNEIQMEWIENNEIHLKAHGTIKGIRSSQIAALVMYLIRIGVINNGGK